MADQLLRQIGIVSQTQVVPFAQVAQISAALQKQVTRDVAPIWNVTATVDPFEKVEDVPLGTWTILLKDATGYYSPGVHLDSNGQPYALVHGQADHDKLSLAVSHECIEMLVDPFGKRLIAGDSPSPEQGRVLFLVEVCDPSEAMTFAYTVNGVVVSDFYTPAFFEPVTAAGVRYSYGGHIQEPRSILEGGYLSWMLPDSRVWWQKSWFGIAGPVTEPVGRMESDAFRSKLDRVTAEGRARAMGSTRAAAQLPPFEHSRNAQIAQARLLEASIADLEERERKRQKRAGPRQDLPNAPPPNV